jgi:hypothetical protein
MVSRQATSVQPEIHLNVDHHRHGMAVRHSRFESPLPHRLHRFLIEAQAKWVSLPNHLASIQQPLFSTGHPPSNQFRFFSQLMTSSSAAEFPLGGGHPVPDPLEPMEICTLLPAEPPKESKVC